MKKIDINKLAIYLIVGSIIFALGRQVYTKIMLSNCYRVTIAIPKEITGGGGKAGNYLQFTYSVNGVHYEGSYGLGNGRYTEQTKRNIIVHKYYVRFACTHPSLSELIFNKEVPGSVVTVPPDGWDKLPE